MTLAADGKEKPVGRAFFVQQGDSGLPLHTAILAIQSVHTDGRLPTIPLLCNKDTQREGSYEYTPFPIIYVSEYCTRIEFITVHEIGHFIDHYGLGNGNVFASETTESSEWQNWHEAISGSKAVNTLKERLDGRKIIQVEDINGNYIDHEIDAAYIHYLRRDAELFARSYVQFIATRSKHPILRQQLERSRKLPFNTIYPAYWDEEDFRDIEATMHGILQAQGWIK